MKIVVLKSSGNTHGSSNLLADAFNRGARRLRFHDLRHSCASLLLANGESMKAIQDWLGHSTFNVTANFYSHLDYTSRISSAETIARVLGDDKNEENEKIAGSLSRTCDFIYAGGGGRTRTVSLPTDFEYFSSFPFEQFSVILCCFLFPILRCFTRHKTRKQAIMRRY